jgi:hypothetical protein
LTTFFDASELEVHALAAAPNGGLLVGTSPDGRIYQVAADGTSKTFFDPEDKYIWALAVDKSGNVFAATGDKGVIYKITPDGKGSPLLQNQRRQRRVTGIRQERRSRRGHRVSRPCISHRQSGKAFVLIDSPFREIHAVRLAEDGTIYAVAVNGPQGSDTPKSLEPPSTEPARAPVPSVSTEITAVSVVDAPVGSVISPSVPRAPTVEADEG